MDKATREDVTLAAQWMDRHYPGWANHVNPETISQSSLSHCVLAQSVTEGRPGEWSSAVIDGPKGKELTRPMLDAFASCHTNEWWADEVNTRRAEAVIPLTRDEILQHYSDGKTFRSMDLRNSDLRSATLHRADFNGADLSHSRFDNCDLAKANFHGAGLAGCSFKGCDLSHANLTGAILERADFRGAKMPALTMILLARWNVSPDLVGDLMRWDAANSPNDNHFKDWRNGDLCPLSKSGFWGASGLVRIERESYTPGTPRPAWALVKDCFREQDIKFGPLVQPAPAWTREQLLAALQDVQGRFMNEDNRHKVRTIIEAMEALDITPRNVNQGGQ